MGGVKSTASSVGCAIGSLFKGYVTGTLVDQATLDKIELGKTNTAGIIALIGHPTDKQETRKGESWIYPYTAITHFQGNTSETTTVEFDKNGIVTAAYKSDGQVGKTGNPLLDAAS